MEGGDASGRRRKLELGTEEALAEKAKASVRTKVEHPFLRLKRLFGTARYATGVWRRTRSGWRCCSGWATC